MSRTYRRTKQQKKNSYYNTLYWAEIVPVKKEKVEGAGMVKTFIYKDGRREKVRVDNSVLGRNDETYYSDLKYLYGDYRAGVFNLPKFLRKIHEKKHRQQGKQALKAVIQKEEAEDFVENTEHLKSIVWVWW